MRVLKVLCFLLLFSMSVHAQQTLPAAPITAADQQIQLPINEETAHNPSLVTRLAVLAGVALLPFAIMLLTSFAKIVIVLSLLRQALGVQQTPPNQVLNGGKKLSALGQSLRGKPGIGESLKAPSRISLSINRAVPRERERRGSPGIEQSPHRSVPLSREKKQQGSLLVLPGSLLTEGNIFSDWADTQVWRASGSEHLETLSPEAPVLQGFRQRILRRSKASGWASRLSLAHLARHLQKKITIDDLSEAPP